MISFYFLKKKKKEKKQKSASGKFIIIPNVNCAMKFFHFDFPLRGVYIKIILKVGSHTIEEFISSL